ncbi:MAG: hypothetical protein M1158_03075 [Candidatus Marsarchaeota archaeon]|jgi:hypothetical protein|nr:hypothetical protein [Candidatus Marsarchaeota archaeon]
MEEKGKDALEMEEEAQETPKEGAKAQSGTALSPSCTAEGTFGYFGQSWRSIASLSC